MYRVKYRCSTCRNVTPQGPEELLSARLWPASHQRVDTVVDERMLQAWLVMQRRNPSCALSGWLEAEALKGRDYGLDGQVNRPVGWLCAFGGV